MRQALFVAVAWVAFVAPAAAQDPVKVDPKHYKVELENDRVRVLRITYGPHEKSVMHEHPANVTVFLTDGQAKFSSVKTGAANLHFSRRLRNVAGSILRAAAAIITARPSPIDPR